jgi:hypothetical protein
MFECEPFIAFVLLVKDTLHRKIKCPQTIIVHYFYRNFSQLNLE